MIDEDSLRPKQHAKRLQQHACVAKVEVPKRAARPDPARARQARRIIGSCPAGPRAAAVAQARHGGLARLKTLTEGH
jgi:hypothetical protein